MVWLYGVLFILADLQAIRLTLYRLTDTSLYLQAGIYKSVTIPLHLINKIKDNDFPEKLTKIQKRTVGFEPAGIHKRKTSDSNCFKISCDRGLHVWF
jgi:hypothetical protein